MTVKKQKKGLWTVAHPPGWPGLIEFCRQCPSSRVWTQWKWLWCSPLHCSFSRSWQSRCWALEPQGSSRRHLLEPRQGAEERHQHRGLGWCRAEGPTLHRALEEDCGRSSAQDSALNNRQEQWLSTHLPLAHIRTRNGQRLKQADGALKRIIAVCFVYKQKRFRYSFLLSMPP